MEEFRPPKKGPGDRNLNINKEMYGTGSYNASPTQKRVSKVSKSSSNWWDDPEMKRKRRIAKYKFYAVEGNVKTSFKKGFRWLKRKCHRILHGF